MLRKNNEKELKEQQAKVDKHCSNVEGFTESIPQFFISISIYAILYVRCWHPPVSLHRTEHEPSTVTILTDNIIFFFVGIMHSGPFNGFKTDSPSEVIKIFGHTTLGISNEIIFPLSIFTSMVIGIKCVIVYISKSSPNINEQSRMKRFVVFAAKLTYTTSAFYGKIMLIFCISIPVAELQLHGYVAFLFIVSVVFILPMFIFLSPLTRLLGPKCSIELILQNPSIIILPFITDFVFAPLDGYRKPNICGHKWLSRCCCWMCGCGPCKFDQNTKVIISPQMSWAKLVYTLVLLLPIFYIVVYGYATNDCNSYLKDCYSIFESLPC